MIQLDAVVPDTMEAMERFIPEEDRLQPDDWIEPTRRSTSSRCSRKPRCSKGTCPSSP